MFVLCLLYLLVVLSSLYTLAYVFFFFFFVIFPYCYFLRPSMMLHKGGRHV